MQISIKSFFNRATWLKVHLYLALLFGLFFALLGLTGSLSIYREELDQFFNSELVVAESASKMRSLDEIFNAVKHAHPNRHGAWTLEMPLSPTGVITAWYDKPQETFFDYHAPLMVAVNPYTAEVVANRFWGNTFTTWILDWHTQLQFGAMGWKLVGIMGCLLLISVSTGLYLWWSGIKNVLLTFKLRCHAGQQTLLLDIHRLIGVCSALGLGLLAITGMNLSYPQLLESLTGSSGMAHGDTGRVIVSTADRTDHPTTLAGAVFVARAAFPKAELRRISTPVGDTGVYRINFRQSSEVNHRHPFTTVWVDHWSGQIKAIRDANSFSAGERLSAWIWPLHTGEALGAKGRFLWFLSGIGLFGLYVTGIWLWLLRSGRLADKAVDYSGLQRLSTRFLGVIRGFGLRLWRYGTLQLKQFTDPDNTRLIFIKAQQMRMRLPLLIARLQCHALSCWQWIVRFLRAQLQRQKRLDKK